MKILLTGASGYVGAKVFKDLTDHGYDVWGTYNKTEIFGKGVKVDLTDRDEVEKLIEKVDPDIIIHAAADAHTKSCMEDPINARKINVDATRYLVDTIKGKDTRLIYFSTFNCFNPTSIYGETKLEAENIVSTLESYLILRFSIIIGKSPNRSSLNFFNDLLDAIEKREPIEMDTSWEFEATCLDHVVNVLEAIINKPELQNLMIPIVAQGVTTRYEIAERLLSKRGVDVKPIDQKRVIPLPEFDPEILVKLGLPQPTIDECLERINKEI